MLRSRVCQGESVTPSGRSNRRRGVFAALRHVGDMAIDLGTANTVVYVRGRGIVLSEPSVVAIDERTGEVHAVGSEAQLMIGRTPASISADRPLRHGVIADFEVTEAMLRRFMDKVLSSRFSRPRLVMCAPSGVTEVERRAVEEASLSAGAREVHLIEESLAAAIGAGLPIAEPVGRMVVDIGGGTSEVAVISLGGLVVSRSLRVGGYDMDEAIANYIRNEHRMAIGSQSAETIKLAVAAATPQEEELVSEVRGRDLMSGLPREVQLTGEEVRGAIAAPLADILAAVHATLEETPPELAADITKEGILLAGGGALLRGLDERLEAETGMPVRIADMPLECVALGAGQSLEELDRMGRGRR
jgi:rod shape-determining protein MreB and related proteins